MFKILNQQALLTWMKDVSRFSTVLAGVQSVFLWPLRWTWHLSPNLSLLKSREEGCSWGKSVSLKQSDSQIIYLVEEGVEGPGEEEADPANGHHDPHLARAQGERDPVDVNQLHVLLHAQLCGDAQPGIREQNKLLEHSTICL